LACPVASGLLQDAQKLSFGLTGRCSLTRVSLRNNFFVTGCICTKLCQPEQQEKICFFVQSLPRRSGRAAGRSEICFLLACPVASAQQSARTKLFLLGQHNFFFCRPIPSAQNFFDFLWRMESLQYTFSESCVRNLNF
jgi:hypothetical protein